MEKSVMVSGKMEKLLNGTRMAELFNGIKKKMQTYISKKIDSKFFIKIDFLFKIYVRKSI